MFKLLCLLYISLFITVSAAATNEDRVCRESKSKRPRQFRMQVYSKPKHKGSVQLMRASNGLSRPCWNLSSKRIGSFDINDPLVKVTFYRSSDCKGIASATFIQNQNHVMMIKANSVSVTKINKYQCNA